MFGPAGLAIEHGQIVVQRGQSAVGGGERRIRGNQRPVIQGFGLIVPPCRPHAGRRVDQRRRPGLRVALDETQTRRQCQRPLDNPRIGVVAALRTVESHRLVEHGQQALVVMRALGRCGCAQQIWFRLFCGFVRVEDRVQSLKKTSRVEAAFVAARMVCIRRR